MKFITCGSRDRRHHTTRDIIFDYSPVMLSIYIFKSPRSFSIAAALLAVEAVSCFNDDRRVYPVQVGYQLIPYQGPMRSSKRVIRLLSRLLDNLPKRGRKKNQAVITLQQQLELRDELEVTKVDKGNRSYLQRTSNASSSFQSNSKYWPSSSDI